MVVLTASSAPGYAAQPVILSDRLHLPSSDSWSYDPLVAEILSQMDSARWMEAIAILSGAQPVNTSQGEARIKTRSNLVMFEDGPTLSAFTYLKDTLKSFGFRQDLDFEVHTYDFPYSDQHRSRNWKNLILTFPGSDPQHQSEQVLLVAHLDSISPQELTLAPGADDNATGAAGLLEAARILRQYQFKRTIRLVWFSGEEYSRRGSEFFVADYTEWLPDMVGVINLDMFGFDWDNDRCFEVHAGTLPGSHRIGNCLAAAIEAYGLELRFDSIGDDRAYIHSDHAAFWKEGVPAVMVIENFSYQPEGVCGKVDRNTQYHQVTDTITYINESTGFAILQSGVAALVHLAEPSGACIAEPPQIHSFWHDQELVLFWEADGGSSYQIWQNSENLRVLLGESPLPLWVLPAGTQLEGRLEIVAISPSGCQSQPAGFEDARLLDHKR